MRYSGISIGKSAIPDDGPTGVIVVTGRGPVRIEVSGNGGVQVTQGEAVTDLPYPNQD